MYLFSIHHFWRASYLNQFQGDYIPVLPPENTNLILYSRVLFLAVYFSETKTSLSKKPVK